VATFNTEGYLVEATASRDAKTPASRAKVLDSLVALRADVLALQEMGGTNAVLELRAALGRAGLEYAHWEWVGGFDTNVQVAVLSRFPIVARRPHDQESFLLNGRRFRVTRGFAEVDLQVAPSYRLTVVNAHLKSRRETGAADQADIREEEARLLRRVIDQRLAVNPEANLVVLGDFNDSKDSRPIRMLLGKGKTALIDTRPAERNGDAPSGGRGAIGSRSIAWTHFYAKEDSYGRLDYILLSPGLAREWDREGTYVLALPGWGLASDHRPIVARFLDVDR
jgi:endonuclease/exonuclease/phosphatase family metal-dependent hydrolase